MAMVDNKSSGAGENAGHEGPGLTSLGLETPGRRLQLARERAGLTPADIAKQLHLLPAQVLALEADDYSGFPGELFIKGHLRSYARLLKLDSATIVGNFRGSAVPAAAKRPIDAPQRARARKSLSLEAVGRKRRHWGILAALMVVLSLWGWQQTRQHGQLQSLTATADSGDAVALGGIDAALSGGDSAALLDSVQLLPSTPAAPSPSANAPTVAGADAQPAPPSADQLSLHFSADCWVEIKDRDNKLLVAVLKHADDELKIEGRGPFKVLLGYAPGVEMAYNGTPVKVDVSDHSRSARLIVGNS